MRPSRERIEALSKGEVEAERALHFSVSYVPGTDYCFKCSPMADIDARWPCPPSRMLATIAILALEADTLRTAARKVQEIWYDGESEYIHEAMAELSVALGGER